ncbi:MAG: hypothetical protein JNK63_02765 [Chthonomonas sp.]|nr:hypothetical protein [Chthonomonas sp.]
MRSSLFLIAGLTASSFAQRPSPVPVDPSLIETVEATGWAPLDFFGNPIGPIQALPEPANARAASWKYAFDSMNSQANALPATGTTPSTLQPLWVIPGNYRAYMWANDVTALNTGTAYGLAKGAYIAFHWNPAATAPASGSLNFAAKIYTARKFDNTGDGPAVSQALGGVMVTIANLSVGTSPYKALPFDLSATPNSIALPGGMNTTTAASIVVELGTYSGSTFAPFNPIVVCSPLFGNMLAPGEPRYPGTNVSRSTDLYWADDASTFTPTPSYTFEDFTNTSGSTFPFCELYTGDTESDPTPANRHGIIQPAISLLVDQNAKVITGQLTFDDQVDSSRLPKTATFQVFDAAGVTLLSTQTVALSPTQTYTIADPNPSTGGTYVVRYVQGNVWLSKRSGVINTTGSPSTTANLLLSNGDIDLSAEVDAADIDLVIANFGMTNVDGIGGDADLSNEVDAADIDVVIANFGATGE